MRLFFMNSLNSLKSWKPLLVCHDRFGNRQLIGNSNGDHMQLAINCLSIAVVDGAQKAQTSILVCQAHHVTLPFLGTLLK